MYQYEDCHFEGLAGRLTKNSSGHSWDILLLGLCLRCDHGYLNRSPDANAEKDLVADVFGRGGVLLQCVEEPGAVEEEDRSEDDVSFGESRGSEEGAADDGRDG